MGVLVHQRRRKRTPDVEVAAEIGTSVRPDVAVAAGCLVLGDGVHPTIARIPAIHDAVGQAAQAYDPAPCPGGEKSIVKNRSAAPFHDRVHLHGCCWSSGPRNASFRCHLPHFRRRRGRRVKRRGDPERQQSGTGRIGSAETRRRRRNVRGRTQVLRPRMIVEVGVGVKISLLVGIRIVCGYPSAPVPAG